LSKAVAGSGLLSQSWLGAPPRKPALEASKGATVVKALVTPSVPLDVTTDYPIGAAKVTYDTAYREGYLSDVVMPDGLTEYPVVIVLIGTLV